jgi:RNA 2',3'-cyclic 3'-phosphodiesterase
MNQPGPTNNTCSGATLRLFIGVACPPLDKVATLLKELQIAALEPNSGIRVIPENNLHITVKFLGSVPSSAVADITAMLDQIAVATKPFAISLFGTGIFKDAYWLGVKPSRPLQELATTLNQRLEPFGFPPETRPYVPHLTVARLEQKARNNFQEWLKQYENESWSNLPVPAVHLFKSTTLPGGVQYSIMHISKFKTPA